MRLFPSSGGIDFGVGAVKEALWKSGMNEFHRSIGSFAVMSSQFEVFCFVEVLIEML